MRVGPMPAWLAWPVPALLAWSGCWLVFATLARAGLGQAAAFTAAAVLGAAASVAGSTPWRRVFIGAGFPLSLAASGAASPLPGWAWLLPLVLLACLYPIGTWRDAPLFPTPAGALDGLAARVKLPPGAAVLDAGCGLGAGLMALHAQYPAAHVEGIEWSRPLRLACAWRCRRFARVRCGDIWQAGWSRYGLVYLFQRPESMARAAEKATRELAPGAWLASLEFPALTLVPDRVLEGADGRTVWLYRAPFTAAPHRHGAG